MGHRGDKGDVGEIGLKGFPGHKGESGGLGATGSNGRKVDKGMTGDPGPPVPIPSCGGPGWRKVAFIDMTDTSQNCPQGLTLTGYSKLSCGRTNPNYFHCSSVITFPVGGGQYSRVCGRAKAYHWGHLHSYRDSRSINAQYVDGPSLVKHPGHTFGHLQLVTIKQTVVHDTNYRSQRCPCNQGNIFSSHPFVGNDYFCESGVSSRPTYGHSIFYPGQGCIHDNLCCSLNKPPWFNKTLPTPTTDDIEVRLCLAESATYSNIALEQIELYVY